MTELRISNFGPTVHYSIPHIGLSHQSFVSCFDLLFCTIILKQNIQFLFAKVGPQGTLKNMARGPCQLLEVGGLQVRF